MRLVLIQHLSSGEEKYNRNLFWCMVLILFTFIIRLVSFWMRLHPEWHTTYCGELYAFSIRRTLSTRTDRIACGSYGQYSFLKERFPFRNSLRTVLSCIFLLFSGALITFEFPRFYLLLTFYRHMICKNVIHFLVFAECGWGLTIRTRCTRKNKTLLWYCRSCAFARHCCINDACSYILINGHGNIALS